jgi:5'-deoxynucleotidase YfbR-like HD superfamily hydrolase
MNLEKLFGTLSGLSGTYRFSNAKLIHRESVLEHLGGVTLTCYFIWHEMLSRDPILLEDVPLSEVLGKAIVHDVEELLMGDIPRTTKYSSTETLINFHLMEENAVAKIHQSLEINSRAMILDHYNAKKDLSGLIVKIADALAVVYKIHEEAVERGNRAMLSRATSIIDQLDHCSKEVQKTELSDDCKAFLKVVIAEAYDIVMRAEDSTAAIREE